MPTTPEQARINTAQGGVNTAQGEVNIAQGKINDAQGDLNTDYFHDGDEIILAAVETFRIESQRLKEAIEVEAKARKKRDIKVNRLFKAVAAGFVVLALLGSAFFYQQQRYNHDRCVATRTTRKALRGNLEKLVQFAIDVTIPHNSATKAKTDKIIIDYRAKLNKDIPDISC